MTDENDDQAPDADLTEIGEDTEDSLEPAGPAERTEAADDKATTEATDKDEDGDKNAGSSRWRVRRLWLSVAAAGLVALVIAGAVVGYVKYRNVSDELAALHQAEADRAAAVEVAKDYALKSLTYSFKDPDAFFRSVKEGVSESLRDKYTNATDLLKGIMLQAQVTSSGEVLATQAIPQPGNVYQVVVSANQTTRNLQHPEERVSLILLQVTVNKVDGKWQVSDIGPKTGTQAPNSSQLPPPQPGP